MKKKWLINGNVTWDKVIVNADVFRVVNGMALFENEDGSLVLAVSAKNFTTILPLDIDTYYKLSKEISELK